jgi:hypothetical protein
MKSSIMVSGIGRPVLGTVSLGPPLRIVAHFLVLTAHCSISLEVVGGPPRTRTSRTQCRGAYREKRRIADHPLDQTHRCS